MLTYRNLIRNIRFLGGNGCQRKESGATSCNENVKKLFDKCHIK